MLFYLSVISFSDNPIDSNESNEKSGKEKGKVGNEGNLLFCLTPYTII
jgi:hypothetical protein